MDTKTPKDKSLRHQLEFVTDLVSLIRLPSEELQKLGINGDVESLVLRWMISTETLFEAEIFDSYHRAADLLNELWGRGFHLIIQEYRALAFKSDKNLPKLSLICKHAKKFYERIIKRTLKSVGTTDEIERIIPGLNFWEDASPPRFQPCSPSMVTVVNVSCAFALTKLGDLSRYQDELDSTKSNKVRRAELFYHCASFVDCDDGASFNQLAKLSFGNKDFFHAIYYVLKSIVIGKPFTSGRANLNKMSRKTLHSPPSTAIESILHCMLEQRNGKSDSVDDVLQHNLRDLVATPAGQLAEAASKDLTRLTLISIMLEKCEGDYSAACVEQYLTVLLKFAVLAVVSDQTLHLSILAPSIRVSFDWFRKYYSGITTPAQKSSYSQLVSTITLLLNNLLMNHPLQFDPFTCAPTLSGQRSLFALDEEKQSLGVAALDGGLNDTPSGLSISSSDKILSHQIQCILFSGHEMAYLEQLGIKWSGHEFSCESHTSLDNFIAKLDASDDSGSSDEEVVFKGRAAAV